MMPWMADAVQDAQTLVPTAEQQLAQAQEHLQLTIPAQQEHWQLIRGLQATQRACWNRSLSIHSIELSGLILGKTSRCNVLMVAMSCTLLRDTISTINAAEPIKFEVSPWAQTRIAAGGAYTLCVNAGKRVIRLHGTAAIWASWVGGHETRVVPTLVIGLLKTKTIMQVAAGCLHNAYLTADVLSYMYVCGNGDEDMRHSPHGAMRRAKGHLLVAVHRMLGFDFRD